MKIIETHSRLSQWQAWVAASRPKILTAAIIPVLVGSALAHGSLEVAFFALLTIICIQIGTNLVNDALDFKSGVDTVNRIGPLRATQSGLLPFQTVYQAGIITFTLAAVTSIPLIIHGGWPIAIIVALSIACGYFYTGGPYPISHTGFADLLVILFYGLAGTVGVYYIHTGKVSALAFLAGAQIGLLATVMTAINNLRDWKGDAKANKKTIPVRFGKIIGKLEITLLILSTFALNFFWLALDFQLASLLPWLTFPLAIKILKKIWNHEPGREYNQFLALAALLHFSFGLLLAFGVYV